MGKMLTLLSILILIMLSIGASIDPQNPMLWLASVNTAYQQIREALITILVLQLATRPPRHVWFRLLSGGIGIFAVVWAAEQTYFNHMQPLDTLAILGASVSIMVTALERKIDGKFASYSLVNRT